MDVGEIAPTTAGYPYFFCNPSGMIKHQHIAVARPSRQRTHQSRGPRPNHHNISFLSRHHHYPTAAKLA